MRAVWLEARRLVAHGDATFAFDIIREAGAIIRERKGGFSTLFNTSSLRFIETFTYCRGLQAENRHRAWFDALV